MVQPCKTFYFSTLNASHFEHKDSVVLFNFMKP